MSMDCATATSLLPSLLAGSLEPVERAALEQHLEGCTACRRELAATGAVVGLFRAHLAPEDLVDYLEKALAPERAALVAGHLDGCGPCREELELLAESRRNMDQAFGPLPTKVLRFPPRALRAPWRWIAVAASLAAVVAGWGWVSTTARVRELLAPAVNVAVVEVLPRELVQRGGSVNEVVLGKAEGRLVLVLVSQGEGRFSEYEVEISDRQGRTLWRASGIERRPEGTYTLVLPAALVAEREIRIVVLGRDGTRRVEVETYELHVRR